MGLEQPHILHLDMDAFFVSVELLDRPDLRGKEVIVGHPSQRGVVTSASYEARAYGVRSAMPMSRATQLCPHAIVIEPHRHKYEFYSQRMLEVLHEYSPLVEALSIDEAFVDISGAFRRLGSAQQIGTLIRERIRTTLQLPASIGISDRKYLAKIASADAKPDGLLVIMPEQRQAYLRQLPVTALWGVGGKTREVLTRYGIQTVADLADFPPQKLVHLLGKAGTHLYELSHGIDPREVESSREEKSISTEETFPYDLIEPAELGRKLLQLSHKVAQRLRKQEVVAKTIGIKVKYSSFKQVVRSVTLEVPTDEAHHINHYAYELMKSLEPLPEPVRLLGVKGENLQNSSVSLQLGFEELGGARRQSEVTMDEIRQKFPSTKIGPASLLTPPE